MYCKLHNTKGVTQRKCPDCPLTPALCQTLDKDCHSEWHSDKFSAIRKLWYDKNLKENEIGPEKDTSSCRGRPKGSINRRRRRGNYRSK